MLKIIHINRDWLYNRTNLCAMLRRLGRFIQLRLLFGQDTRQSIQFQGFLNICEMNALFDITIV